MIFAHYNPKIKSVKFNLHRNTIHEMYSSDEYDRHQIDSLLYLKSYGRITRFEWFKALLEVNVYKLMEMPVHNDSVVNTKLHQL